MPETLSDPEFRRIFKRIQAKIDLSDCRTIDDVIKKLIQHPNFDGRILTLITKMGESGKGFPEFWLEKGLTESWRTETWRNVPDSVVRVRRYAKGTIINGKNVGGRFMSLGYMIFKKDQLERLRKEGLISW